MLVKQIIEVNLRKKLQISSTHQYSSSTIHSQTLPPSLKKVLTSISKSLSQSDQTSLFLSHSQKDNPNKAFSSTQPHVLHFSP